MDNRLGLIDSFNQFLPPAPRGVPQVEVTFDIDANGIVNVSARDRGSGKEQQIVIQSSGGLSKDQIENMIREAERHAAEDAEKKELIETVNQAESVVHDTQSKLAEYADQLNAEESKALNEEIEKLKKKLENRDGLKAAEVKEIIDTVQKQSLKLFEAAYKKMAAQNQQQNQSTSEPNSSEQTADSQQSDEAKKSEQEPKK